MMIQKYYDGTMVRVSDYKKLEAEIDRLREALEEIAESDELAQHIAKQALEQSNG